MRVHDRTRTDGNCHGCVVFIHLQYRQPYSFIFSHLREPRVCWHHKTPPKNFYSVENVDGEKERETTSY